MKPLALKESWWVRLLKMSYEQEAGGGQGNSMVVSNWC